MEYIESAKGPRGCIFCTTADDTPSSASGDGPSSASAAERLILHRGERSIVLLNRYPYAAGHLMVAPHLHCGEIERVDAASLSELMARIADTARILRKTYDCEGMNIGANLGAAGGAGFAEHLHFHVVPRWNGDTNFMTALGEVRVIPEHLERTYERLLPQFQELSKS
ncbi:MAG: HIT domain-containing protein [bacterium]|nr:HIT domain-containing protein [bacterium]